MNRWSIEDFDDYSAAHPVENYSSRKLQPPNATAPTYQLSIDPSAVVIGDTTVNMQSNWYPVRITNTGLRKVLLRNVTVTEGFNMRDRWDNRYLQPGETFAIYVGAIPRDSILYNGILVINTNQGISFSIPISVQGQRRELVYDGRAAHNGDQQYNGVYNTSSS